MKTTLKYLKRILKEALISKMEGVDRVKRSKHGYSDEVTDDDYQDVSEDMDLTKLLDKALEDQEDDDKKDEGVDRVKRGKHGYTDEESADDYHDVSEDSDRLRRHADGYGDEMEEHSDMTDDPMDDEFPKKGKGHATVGGDHDVGGGPPGSLAASYDPLAGGEVPDPDDIPMQLPKLKEIAPSEDQEAWIQSNKEDFKKRYGARWREVLYSTANKMFGQKSNSKAEPTPHAKKKE